MAEPDLPASPPLSRDLHALSEPELSEFPKDHQTEDIWTLQETPPLQDSLRTYVAAPDGPITPKAKDQTSNQHKSSAGHTPRRTGPLTYDELSASPAGLPTSNSVSFLSNPVSGTKVYNEDSPLQRIRSEPQTPQSSPLVERAEYKSPMDKQSELPARKRRARLYSDLAMEPSRENGGLLVKLSPALKRKRHHSLPIMSSIEKSKLRSSKTKQLLWKPKEDTLQRSESLECLASNSPSMARMSRTPTHFSPGSPSSTPKPRHSASHRGPESTTAINNAPASEVAPRPGRLARIKNAARTKMFGLSGSTTPKRSANNHTATSRKSGSETRHSGIPPGLDLGETFILVEGNIKGDREIKELFKDNSGLCRVWKNEAVPLYKKGDKEGFDERVKMLQTAMAILAGKVVMFG